VTDCLSGNYLKPSAAPKRLLCSLANVSVAAFKLRNREFTSSAGAYVQHAST
jgi:hypothetical protein